MGAYSDALALLNALHTVANVDSLANNLVSDTQRPLVISPAAGDGVDIGATDSAHLDLDVDIVGTEWLGLELLLLELRPRLGRGNAVALEGVWVAHG